jgi:hypothetical protein
MPEIEIVGEYPNPIKVTGRLIDYEIRVSNATYLSPEI